MPLTSDHTLPGDSGYEYPDDEPDEDEAEDPHASCYFGYGPYVDRGNCLYFGCFHQGMWSFPKVAAGDPEY